MDLDKALEHALNGDAVVFLGAGFSIDAVNGHDEKFKTAAEFAEHLNAKLKKPLDSASELPDIAEEFLNEYGRSVLNDELIKEFRASRVGDHHVAIANVPWMGIYTTNYDNVFELASSSAGIPIKPITLSELPRDYSHDDSLCIHFNGYVERLTMARGDEIRLTDTSYVTTSVEQSPWSSVFRQDIQRAKAVFFIGYSMGDLDISRLLPATEDLRQKTFFVVGPSPSSRTENRTARYGTLEKVDTVSFSERLRQKKTSYNPPEKTHPTWYCVQPYQSVLADVEAISDAAIFDLIWRGIIDGKLLSHSLHKGANTYVVERDILKQVLTTCLDTTKIAVLDGSLGNGKTIVAESVKVQAAAKGIPVYSLERRSPQMYTELSYLASLDSPFLLVIDAYPGWLDVVEFLSTHENKRMSLLFTARTTQNDVLADRLREMFKGRHVHEISVDKQGDVELLAVDKLFQQYGLWGDKAGFTSQRRVNGLRDICHGEWQSILVEVFQAPQIASKFNEILKTLDEKNGYYDVLIGILALTVINNETVTINMLVDIFGTRVLDTEFQRDGCITEFIDFRSGEVLSRSSVAAQFLLRHVADPKITVDVLARMAASLDKKHSLYRAYSGTIRSFVQFSQLETVLPNRSIEQLRDATFSYYEQIKNLDYCRENPQFWLQYAIAATVFRDLERAQSYFDSAYSFADNKPFPYDTSKIDNHYARFLLMKACSTASKAEAMELFRSAREILFDQIQDERLHYPYRVAAGFGEFFDKFAKDFTKAELKEIVEAASFVESRITSLLPEMQRNRYVDACTKVMRRVKTAAAKL